MIEVKITKCIVNERKELNISMIVKEGDYSQVEAELLRQAKINGDLLDLAFTWLIKEDPNKNRKTKLQKLAWLMSVYCEKSWNNYEDEKVSIYLRNKIKSRTELTDEQLDYEIDLYINWLKEYA